MFYLTALAGWITKSENKLIKIIFYYCMTVIAQWNGVINIITGKAKPTWEKAESTRQLYQLSQKVKKNSEKLWSAVSAGL